MTDLLSCMHVHVTMSIVKTIHLVVVVVFDCTVIISRSNAKYYIHGDMIGMASLRLEPLVSFPFSRPNEWPHWSSDLNNFG